MEKKKLFFKSQEKQLLLTVMVIQVQLPHIMSTEKAQMFSNKILL